MLEYPKVIHLSGGLTLTVKNEADEAKWRETEPVPELEPESAVYQASEPEPEPALHETHAHLELETQAAPKTKAPKTKHVK